MVFSFQVIQGLKNKEFTLFLHGKDIIHCKYVENEFQKQIVFERLKARFPTMTLKMIVEKDSGEEYFYWMHCCNTRIEKFYAFVHKKFIDTLKKAYQCGIMHHCMWEQNVVFMEKQSAYDIILIKTNFWRYELKLVYSPDFWVPCLWIWVEYPSDKAPMPLLTDF